jgi:hypothetical protein
VVVRMRQEFVDPGEDATQPDNGRASSPLDDQASAAAGGVAVAGRHFVRSIAYHESGHTISALVLGLPVAGVSVRFRDGHHGEVWASDDHRNDAINMFDLVAELQALMPPPFASRELVAPDILHTHNQVISLLAGIEGELLFVGESLPRTGHDAEQARTLATLVCHSSRSIESYLEFCRVEARNLLVQYRELVNTLADALVERQELDGAEIQRIIRLSTNTD